MLIFLLLLFAGRFRRYEYGLVENKKKYGRMSPPSINLSNIRAPVALYYSKGDPIVTPAVSINAYLKVV